MGMGGQWHLLLHRMKKDPNTHSVQDCMGPQEGKGKGIPLQA
jgi:hypothetical protein